MRVNGKSSAFLMTWLVGQKLPERFSSTDKFPVVTNAHVVCSDHEAQHTSVALNGSKLFFKNSHRVNKPSKTHGSDGFYSTDSTVIYPIVDGETGEPWWKHDLRFIGKYSQIRDNIDVHVLNRWKGLCEENAVSEGNTV